jgi:hypothetical protein
MVKRKKTTIIRVAKMPANLWAEAGAAARLSGQKIYEWLADAIREKLQRERSKL